MTPRLIGVVDRGVFKPLGRVHLFPPGMDADGDGTFPLTPGAVANSCLGRSPYEVNEAINGVGVGSPTPTTWMDEHRHGDEGGEW